MKIRYEPTHEEVRKKRQEEYLKQFPVEIQLEALTEAAMGRGDKLDKLVEGLAEIRKANPYIQGG